jgi:tetratricopeptide (TPR) repeat protein
VRIPFRADHARYLRRNEWIPFERLIAIKRSDAEYKDHALAPAFYAQAWATAYFATAVDQPLGWRVTLYLRARESGVSPSNAAPRLVGTEAAEANSGIASFVRRMGSVLRSPSCWKAQATKAAVRRLDGDESARPRRAVRLGDRSEKALALFQQVGSSQPDNARARAGTAWALLQSGRREEAGEILDAIADPAGTDASPPLPWVAVCSVGR